MTVRELSLFAGKNRTTIERWCAKCTSIEITGKLQNAQRGSPAEYTINEVAEILTAGSMSRDAVAILIDNARSVAVPAVTTDHQELARTVVIAVVAAMKPFIDKLAEIAIAPAMPAQVALPEYTTHMPVFDYCRVHGIDIEGMSWLRSTSLLIKGICIQRNLEIQHEPHPRYNRVNSYPVEILNEYFKGGV